MKNPHWTLAGICFFSSIGCLEFFFWRISFECVLLFNGVILFGFFAILASIAKDEDKKNEEKK